MPSIGARAFVFVVFAILGGSFVATTLALYREFGDTYWFSFATFYSHLFIFFPTFGLIALLAFFTPSAVFVDMYWKHIRFGRVRFLIGMLVVMVASWGLTQLILKGDAPTLWDVSPATLAGDRGEPAGCDSTTQSCRRLPILTAMETVREVSTKRTGLSPFVRECAPDPMVELPPDLLAERYCFVTRTKLTAAACCEAQSRFVASLRAMYANPDHRSQTGAIHKMLLPLKIFFLLVLLVIGLMLVIWRRKVDELYAPLVSRIERGILIGAAVMVIWPATNHAFLQSAAVLYGSFGKTLYVELAPVFSILFGAWALMLLIFFFRRFEENMVIAGKVLGIAGSLIAVLKYEELIDWSVRVAGSGSNAITLAVLLAVALFAVLPLMFGIKIIAQIDGGATGKETKSSGAD